MINPTTTAIDSEQHLHRGNRGGRAGVSRQSREGGAGTLEREVSLHSQPKPVDIHGIVSTHSLLDIVDREPSGEVRIARRRRDRKSTRLNSSHSGESRMPSSA